MNRVLAFPITRESIGIFFITFSLLITPFYIRNVISPIFQNLNILYYIGIFLLARKLQMRISFPSLLLWGSLCAMFFTSELLVGTSTNEIILLFSIRALPLFICFFSSGADTYTRKTIVEGFIRSINICVLLVFAILLIDLISENALTRVISTTLHIEPIERWTNPAYGRHPSIWGHYLQTAYTYLFFFSINIAYLRVYKQQLINTIVLYTVTIVGVLSTGSKVPIVILIFTLFIVNIRGNYRIAKILLAILITIFLSFTQVLDGILQRFQAQDLSSGRNDAITAVLNSEYPRFFIGYGSHYQSHFEQYLSSIGVSVSAEYPGIALAYSYGVLFVVFTIILLCIPTVRSSIKNHSILLFLLPLLTYADLLGFNGLMVNPDSLMLQVLLIFIIGLMRQTDHLEENIA